MKYFIYIDLFCLYIFRANNNWQINYASITKTSENASQTTKKQREIGETARDSLAYSCLLKNELLGSGIDDVKSVADDRNENIASNVRRGLFKYQSPTKQVRNQAHVLFNIYILLKLIKVVTISFLLQI